MVMVQILEIKNMMWLTSDLILAKQTKFRRRVDKQTLSSI